MSDGGFDVMRALREIADQKGGEGTIEHHHVTVVVGNGAVLWIGDERGMMVRVAFDGTISYAEHYRPSEAAQAFWLCIARQLTKTGGDDDRAGDHPADT